MVDIKSDNTALMFGVFDGYVFIVFYSSSSLSPHFPPQKNDMVDIKSDNTALMFGIFDGDGLILFYSSFSSLPFPKNLRA
jgi:hypothetical protein